VSALVKLDALRAEVEAASSPAELTELRAKALAEARAECRAGARAGAEADGGEEGMSATDTLVIYHAGCPDGFAAAWSVWHEYGDWARYEPWQYGDEPPFRAAGEQRLVIVDFSFKRPVMERLIAEWPSLICLDHHKTAQADLEGLPGCYFDMERSGAAMAWDYFSDGMPRPWVIDYVQDRDLWRFALPNSREVSAWTMAQPHTFEAWDALAAGGVENAVRLGGAIRIHVAHYCEHMAKQTRLGRVGGLTMPVVNAPMFNVSDLLHAVCLEYSALNNCPVAACAWWVRADGKVQHSLRSVGDIDVSEIAKQYGGGGHKNAAGFEADRCVAEFRS
jgi:hypothetical protein